MRSILGIYDFGVQPYSIGDFILFQQICLASAELAGASRCDVCLVADYESHADPCFDRYITPDNRLGFIHQLMTLLELNPLCGDVHIFKDAQAYRRFMALADNRDRLGPFFAEHARDYYFYPAWKLFRACHELPGGMPLIALPEYVSRWAEAFLREHAAGLVPVSVNLRDNHRLAPERNADREAWLAFFEACHGRFPAKFLVVCGTEEFDRRLEGLPNVEALKAHRSDLLQDLAVLRASAMHMGVSSGPTMLPIFGGKPYVIFRDTLDPATLGPAARPQGEGYQFFFSTPDQKMTSRPDTVENLIAEFEARFESALSFAGQRAAKPYLAEAAQTNWLR
jgi:hypothetical protein